METKSGVWIDSSKAFVIDLKENDTQIETVDSPILNKNKINGEEKNTGKFSNNYHNHEKSLTYKKVQQTKSYLRDVITRVKGSNELVIFGPASMKRELKKAIDNEPNSQIRVSDVVSAESMTTNQMVAWVRKYYQE